ncbi:MAG: hypothetical protein R3A79_02450 [Nannocystaceae bacterium]
MSRRRAAAPVGLLGLIGLIALVAPALSCGGVVKAEVVDVCVDEPERCPACARDDDCSFQGNACTEVVVCAHDDAGLVFVELGCSEALERRWPDDEACACVDQVCQSGLVGDDW